MASPQQSRIQSYLERNKIGALFEELMTKLISETPDRPIPFLIDHLQSKQDSPGKMHRALSGSAALWAQSSPESKKTPRELRHNDKPWQIQSRKPKKSKSDLAVSSLSPPSPESTPLPQCPSWDWRDSRDLDELNHILLESKKLGRALESLSRSIGTSDDIDQNLGGFTSVLRPRVVGEWTGRPEEDADPLAAEMLRPPAPRVQNHVGWSGDRLSVVSLKMEAKGSKGLKALQQHHRNLLAAKLAQESLDPLHGLTACLGEDEMDDRDDDDDDAMELLEDLDDLRMEGVCGLAPSGCKFSQGRSSYYSEPQAKVTLNICSRCARLQGDSLTTSRSQEKLPSEQAVPDISPALPRVDALASAAGRLQERQAPSQVSSSRQPVWESDLKAGRTGGLLLGDPLFSKELENMGKQLAEVEKDLAKLAEVGKMTVRNNPHGSLLRGPLGHRSLPDTLPLTSLLCRPRSPAGKTCAAGGLPLVSPGSASLRPGGRAYSNPGSRTHTPGTTPDNLRSGFNPHKEATTFRRCRSRPVTPTGQPARTRPLLTPPGLSTTDSLGASLRAYLAEDEFYQQLQAMRQPWHIPSDTDSDIMEPPEQDKSASKRSVFSGL